MNPIRVAIVGATGVTGGFAFDEAEARGLRPIAVGRNAAKLDAFVSSRGIPRDRRCLADVHDTEALKHALQDVPIVISTVAPYVDNGYPVARAAAELGIGYIDATGEAAFMQRVVAELDELAVQTGATLCTANGAAAFVGDIAMRWITDQLPSSSGTVLYDIQNYKPSLGTMQSYIKHIVPGGGSLVRDGHVSFQPLATFSGSAGGASGIHGVMPDPFVISRYWPAHRLDGLLRAPSWSRPVIRAATRPLAWRPVGSALLRLPLDRILRYDPAGIDASTVTALAEFRPESGSIQRRRVRGRGVYPLTGAALAATAQAMLRRQPRPTGVRAASEMFISFEEAIELSGMQELPTSSSIAARANAGPAGPA